MKMTRFCELRLPKMACFGLVIDSQLLRHSQISYESNMAFPESTFP
jgi:hypothetical protein